MEDERKSDAARNFDSERAQKYDQWIRTAVPGYEALHSMAHSLLRLDLEKQARLLIVVRAPAWSWFTWARVIRGGDLRESIRRPICSRLRANA